METLRKQANFCFAKLRTDKHSGKSAVKISQDIVDDHENDVKIKRIIRSMEKHPNRCKPIWMISSAIISDSADRKEQRFHHRRSHRCQNSPDREAACFQTSQLPFQR